VCGNRDMTNTELALRDGRQSRMVALGSNQVNGHWKTRDCSYVRQ